MVVVPGLVDIHAHVFHGPDLNSEYANGPRAVPPDGFTFRAGVTTVVDAGGSGWRNFAVFKRQVIDVAKTRVLAFLNIVGGGMADGPGGAEPGRHGRPPVRAAGQPTTRTPSSASRPPTSAAPSGRRSIARSRPGKMANLPVMVDFGEFVPERPFRDLVGKHLRPGDIYTHTYLGVVPMLDARGRVNPFMFEARKRGVIFDVGHGGGSFVFRQAVPAMKQGFRPDTLSTDLHIVSMNGGMKDLSNVMSKFMAMGMPLEEAVARATAEPARVIKRPELGQIGVGSAADVAVFSVRKGKFGFTDVDGGRLDGDQKLECELTLRAGKVVWDLNGISGPAVAGTEAEGRGAGALAAEARSPEAVTSGHNRMLSISRVAPTNAATRITPGTSSRSIGARVSALRIST